MASIDARELNTSSLDAVLAVSVVQKNGRPTRCLLPVMCLVLGVKTQHQVMLTLLVSQP